MPSAKNINRVDPVPRYIMPDASEPDYAAILEQLQQFQYSLIGSSYFYIRAGDDNCSLCRIVPGGGKIYFHEIVDHEKLGISEDDLEEAVQQDTGKLTIPSHYPITPHIEMKLHALLDFQ